TTVRVSPLCPDSVRARLDSLALRAQRDHERARCERNQALEQGTIGAVSGGIIGAVLGAVPATLLSLLNQHTAARTALGGPTVGGAVVLGLLGAAVGPLGCH